jgi:hypothetical protein
MPQKTSHPNTKTDSRHANGQPCHFAPLDQDDRIRRVFDVADEAPLPPVDQATLVAYYDYLARHLALPFDALYCQNGGKMRHLIHYVQVTELLCPRQGNTHPTDGLLSRARCHDDTLEMPLTEFGVMEDNPNCQLIDDYAYWLVNYR